MSDMRNSLRMVYGVMGIGLAWSLMWGAVFTLLVLFIGIVRPEDIDPGEGSLQAALVGSQVGFVSGLLYGILLSIAENRKPIPGLTLIRVAVWGMLAATAWPLITAVHDSMLILLCPLGAMCAAWPLTIARRGESDHPDESGFRRGFRHVFRDPLLAVLRPGNG